MNCGDVISETSRGMFAAGRIENRTRSISHFGKCRLGGSERRALGNSRRQWFREDFPVAGISGLFYADGRQDFLIGKTIRTRRLASSPPSDWDRQFGSAADDGRHRASANFNHQREVCGDRLLGRSGSGGSTKSKENLAANRMRPFGGSSLGLPVARRTAKNLDWPGADVSAGIAGFGRALRGAGPRSARKLSTIPGTNGAAKKRADLDFGNSSRRRDHARVHSRADVARRTSIAFRASAAGDVFQPSVGSFWGGDETSFPRRALYSFRQSAFRKDCLIIVWNSLVRVSLGGNPLKKMPQNPFPPPEPRPILD